MSETDTAPDQPEKYRKIAQKPVKTGENGMEMGYITSKNYYFATCSNVR